MALVALIALTLCAGLSGSADAAVREAVTIEDHPYIVQVDFRSVGAGTWYHSCAGSILNIHYILSAANCFSGIAYNPSNRRIRAGSAKRNVGGVLHYVANENNHPSYGRIGNDGDISVVRVIQPFVYTDEIRPGIIIAQGVVFYGGLPLIHVGWGSTIQEGSASDELVKNDIFSIDNQFCRERYHGLSIPEYVTENMICVGFLNPVETDACFADFGGPINYYDSEIGEIVVGIGSWGHGCSNGTFPAVASAVGSYSDWIVSIAV